MSWKEELIPLKYEEIWQILLDVTKYDRNTRNIWNMHFYDQLKYIFLKSERNDSRLCYIALTKWQQNIYDVIRSPELNGILLFMIKFSSITIKTRPT